MFKFLSKQTDIKSPGVYTKIPSYDDKKISSVGRIHVCVGSEVAK